MKANLIILGAGKPRSSDCLASDHNIIGSQTLIDKQLEAFNEKTLNVVYVAGYCAPISEKYSKKVLFITNEKWHSTGSLFSLSLALKKLREINEKVLDTYVIYSDVFFDKTALHRLDQENNNSLAVGTVNAQFGYDHFSNELLSLHNKNLAFSGILKISAPLLQYVKATCDRLIDVELTSTVGHLVSVIMSENNSVVTLQDIDEHWAHIEKTVSVNRFIFKSKSQNLISLSKKLQRSVIPNLHSIKLHEFLAAEDIVLDKILLIFEGTAKLVIRSSAQSEDNINNSNAGAFLSILDVKLERSIILDAIKRVFASYKVVNLEDEVLVQTQVDHVAFSGVMFTRSLETLAPYYEINLSMSSDTAAITSGATNDFEHHIISREEYETSKKFMPGWINRLVDAAIEIERACGYSALDIEFAVDQHGIIHTLQVRPLVSSSPFRAVTKDKYNKCIVANLGNRIFNSNNFADCILGDAPVWSNMSDWNPAEIIGTRPNPLALSLYKFLITDSVWAQQRYEVGYRDLRNIPLIHDFYGHPYVDVRASLSSFIPADVDKGSAVALVQFALDKLKNNPHLHDRVEFDFFPTSTTLTSDSELLALCNEGILGLSELGPYISSLREVTKNIIEKIPINLNKTRQLENPIRFSGDTTAFSCWLSKALADCIEFGTLPFAHAARAGFVAVSFLKSMAKKGLVQENTIFDILESFDGLGNFMQGAAVRCNNGTISQDEFIEIFGHLRPGTYDITVPAYSEDPDTYLYPILKSSNLINENKVRCEYLFDEKVDNYIKQTELFDDFEDLRDFCEIAINARELSKFRFSKQVSVILDGIRDFGSMLGLAVEDLQYTHLEDFLELSLNNNDLIAFTKRLRSRIEKRRFDQNNNMELKLPSVIRNALDLKYFKEMDFSPSFITNKIGEGEILKIAKDLQLSGVDLKQKIVVVENADPGYDFLFSREIAGFITCFGGPNSHMAIRSAELGLPAVIGVGRNIFNKLLDGQLIRLNCLNKKIERLRN